MSDNLTLINQPYFQLAIMHARCQESFKHSIPPQSTLDLYRPLYPHPARPSSRPEPSNCRINITFRFYRPDFQPKSTPRCKCGVPTILRPDMKNRHDGKTDRYWWVCYAAAQNDGKGCDFWRVMDMQAERRSSAFADPCQVESRGSTNWKSDTSDDASTSSLLRPLPMPTPHSVGSLPSGAKAL